MPEDPKTRLTKFITSGEDNPEQKTRLISREQLAFTFAYDFTGGIKELEVPEFKDMAAKSMLLMMSYQGRRSDDIVEMTRGLDEQQLLTTGVQEIISERKERRASRHGVSVD